MSIITLNYIFKKSLLKMMKIAFYFAIKALFVFKIFLFLSSIFGHVENSFMRKIWLI